MTTTACLTPGPVAASSRPAHWLIVLFALLAVFRPGTAGAQATLPLEDGHAVTTLFRLAGLSPDFEFMASQTNQYQRAHPLEKEEVLATLVRGAEAAFDNVGDANHFYRGLLRSSVSDYNMLREGYHINAFNGDSYIPLNPPNYGGLRWPFPDEFVLIYTNPGDFSFVPTDRQTALEYIKARRRPSGDLDMVLQPVGYAITAKNDQAFRFELHCRIVSVKAGGNEPWFEKSVEPLTPAEVRTRKLEIAKGPMHVVGNEEVAMTWARLSGEVTPATRSYVEARNSYLRDRNQFQFERQTNLEVSRGETLFGLITGTRPMTFRLGARLGSWDATSQRLTLESPVTQSLTYSSQFPYEPIPGRDATRMSSFRQHEYVVRFSNPDAVSSIACDQATADFIKSEMSRRNQAELRIVAVPVEVGTLGETEDRTRRYITCKIVDAKVFVNQYDAKFALVEKSFDAPEGPVTVKESAGIAIGVDPYDVDIREMKLGMTRAELLAAAKEGFPRVEEKGPRELYLVSGDSREWVTVKFTPEDKVSWVFYTRSMNGYQTTAMKQALVAKYGEPIPPKRRGYDPFGRTGGGVAGDDMQWTNPEAYPAELRGDKVGVSANVSHNSALGKSYMKVWIVDPAADTPEKAKPRGPKIEL